ncbi:hypothetical protein OROMI_013225 [Orobanche minor]
MGFYQAGGPLSLENNMFNRQVPASLGKFVNLVVLVLNTNNLTGSIPAELSHLPKLNEMRATWSLSAIVTAIALDPARIEVCRIEYRCN